MDWILDLNSDGATFTGNVNVMLFIRAPATPPGPWLVREKERESLYALGRKGKKKSFGDQVQKTQGDCECSGCQALGIHG